MARKSSQDVYHLVKSLTPSEKRYFKIYSNLHTVGEQNKYAYLFDIIESADVIDEELIEQAVSATGDVTFSKLKKYLYDLLLKALRNYNAEKSGIHLITSYLNDLATLFNKGLYEQADKICVKAEKLIVTEELFSYQLIIDNWKKRIQLHYQTKKSKKEAISNYVLKHIADYQKLDFYIGAYGLLKDFVSNHSVLNDCSKLPESVRQVISGKPVGLNESYKIQYFYNRIMATYSRMICNEQAYLDFAKKCYSILKENPSLSDEDFYTFEVDNLIEYSNALLRNRQYGEYKNTIKKVIPNLSSYYLLVNPIALANIQAKINLMKSEYDRLNGKYAEAETHIKLIKKIQIDPFVKTSDSFKCLYHWELINWYFVLGKYDIAIDEINILENSIQNFQTKDAAFLLKLICYFELKDYTNLHIRLTSNTLQSKLVKLLTQVLQEQINNESISLWMKTKKQLQIVFASHECIHFKFFDFIKWVNGKMLSNDSCTQLKKQLHYYHM